MKPRIIHLHIPKSAGSTFNKCLQYLYKAEEIQAIKGHFNSSYPFDSADPSKMVVYGHVDMAGIRENPGFTAYRIVSFIRNPADRIISGYYNILRDKRNPVHEITKGMSLLEYVKSGIIADLENGQVKRISMAGARQPGGIVTEADLNFCIDQVVSGGVLIGISEFFDESLFVICKSLGVTMPLYITVNKGKNKKSGNSIPDFDEVLKEIVLRNKYDFMFYEFCLNVFKARPPVSAFARFSYRARNFFFYLLNFPRLLVKKFEVELKNR